MSRWDERTPTGIAVGLGVGFLLVGAVLGATVPGSDPVLRLAPVAVAVVLTGALTSDRLATAGVAVTAMLVVNGFLVNEDGQLSWHGAPDLWRIGVLAMAAVVGLLLAVARRTVRVRVRRDRRSITPNPRW